ncbi:MAG: 3-dehydroquinate synthase [Acidobacteria bacterium]|nr:3-dehydroquinate synthase [Acidobacteriota bacterium]
MDRMTVSGERGSYEVVVGLDLLGRMPGLLDGFGAGRRIAVVSNTVVGPLWARDVAASVGAGEVFELPDGETFKRWPQVESLCGWLLDRGWRRGDMVLAVGGGVTTDLAGFAAAVYLRGIRWIAVPTTLLAMVDASVGGKTGINLDVGKNLVGAFWAPDLVVADVATLATLPRRELRAGLAEVIKTAWIGDRDILDRIPRGRFERADAGRWLECIVRAIRVKARIVEDDERESGRRQVLNLGHTLGHALETATRYRRFLHGEAVAWGMRAAALLALDRGLMTAESSQSLTRAIDSLGPLPPLDDLDPNRLVEIVARDKKTDAEGVAWVLPTTGGVVPGQRVSSAELRDVITRLQRQAAAPG